MAFVAITYMITLRNTHAFNFVNFKQNNYNRVALMLLTTLICNKIRLNIGVRENVLLAYALFINLENV